MNDIYIIERLDFDNFENANNLRRQIIGYRITEGGAGKLVKVLNSKSAKYKGWDGNEYPQFKCTKVKYKIE